MKEQKKYLRKLWVLFLVLTMVVSMMPTMAFAAGEGEEPTEITTAEEFAAMKADGNYRLANDITVTEPYKSTFKGTFDGDGNTVNLNINVTSGNAGLFSETGSGAVIRNVNVHADVTSSVASASYGTGGLIGKVSYPATIENCGVSGTVTNTASSGSAVYIGGLVGYQNDTLNLKNCYSAAAVTSNGTYYSSSAGGLVGKGANYAITAENCYSSGDVNVSGGYAGGLIGNGYANTAKPHSYINCYAAGTVTGSSDVYGFMYYNSGDAYCTVKNCYYNSDNEKGFNGTAEGLSGKSAEELRGLAGQLGGEYREDTGNLNGGYPILNWQYIDPEATAEVTLTVEPENSVLTWNGQEQEVSASGVYTFSGVKTGKYSYQITNEAGDYAPSSGTISVRGKDIAKNIVLQLNRHELTFSLSPEDGELAVSQGEQILTPQSEHTYSVVNGTYDYEASAFGYKTKKGTTVVDRGDKTETIELEKQPEDRVTFSYGEASGVTGGKISVQTGTRTMEAEDGSNGLIYRLPAGYEYTWTFTSANYARQTGVIDLTETTEAKSETVTIPMEEKTAWEGEGDVTEPEADSEGIYQISSGSELAWLAQQINSGKNTDCSAVLTKDIDLGGQPWTPIGKVSASYAFKGIFDGQDFTVKNLNIETASAGNYGLFGYVYGGTVKNLTVSGSITVSGSGSSSYGLGGITGKFDGTGGAMENCVNQVKIDGGQNVGGIVGLVSGGYNTADKQIKNCANLAEIRSNGYNAGGIVGHVSGQILIDSCYNRADSTAGSYRAGGIAAYLSSSYGQIKNCYSTGSASAAYGSDQGSIVGKRDSGTVENCFYLDSTGSDAYGQSKTSEELKGMAATLGESFVTAPATLNDGYPVLRFQIPTYPVIFITDAVNSVVEIEGQTGSQVGQTWTFDLPEGTYDYSVYAYGKVETQGRVTVSGKETIENVSLKDAERKTITFAVSPQEADAQIDIIWKGQIVESGGSGQYTLPYGEYTYRVKAKGYGRVSETLQVSENSQEKIEISLSPSVAWDGETREQPDGEGTEQSPYQIESGEQLAWFAQKVNEGTGALYAELVGDIDLGNFSWTPIGTDFHEFQGTFDGGGYTVSGLNVSDTEYAGLFGMVKGAVIKNLIVEGTVEGSREAGGIAARAKTTDCSFINCGNEAKINGAYAGGIVGRNFTYGVSCTIEGCYNAGTITAEERAGGLIGYNGGKLAVKDCYNTASVKSSDYAGGVLGGAGGINVTVTYCYNSGSIDGKDTSKTGAFGTGSMDQYSHCYYLEGTAGDNSGSAEKVTSAQLQNLDISDAFTHVSGINQGYPVLLWQDLQPIVGDAQLAEDTDFVTEKVHIPSFVEVNDEESYRLATPEVRWKAVDGAEQYALTLWEKALVEKEGDVEKLNNFLYWTDEEVQKYLSEEQMEIYSGLKVTVLSNGKVTHPKAEYLQKIFQEQELKLPSHYVFETTYVMSVTGIKGTSCDLSSQLENLPEGVYYAAVVPMNQDGSYAMPTKEQVDEEITGVQIPYNRLKPVTGLKWEGTTACWDGKNDFGSDCFYTVKLYKVSDDTGEKQYELFKTFEVGGNTESVDLGNVFTAETDYAFSVIAHTSQDYMVSYGLTDSPESEKSPVYDTGSSETPSDEHEGWIAISSAKEWIELANVEDVPSVSGDASSPSRQEVEWSKNYYLTADIDFSQLSAVDQAKTKSIGNVNHRFMGTLDGNGYKIKGLTLSNSDAGLFWYIGSTGYVYDLTVENANVLFSDNAAVIAQMNYGRIERCAVINCNITADTGAVLGGMVSRNYGIVRESYVQGGSLSSNTQTATGHAGFVGANEEGGLIERCWTSMDVTTGSDYSGGFVGLGYGGTIRDCFALGDVSARGYSGGFVGRSVFEGNHYENCYAAGTVTVSDSGGRGFIGGNKPGSAFQTDQSEGIVNCYYSADAPEDENCTGGARTAAEMRSDQFLTELNKTGSWTRQQEQNDGLPYLKNVAVPREQETEEITVEISLAVYDKESYSFEKMGETISVTMESGGNTRLTDLMDEAVNQKKLTYAYDTTSSFGRYIRSINGYDVEPPDGWMFTINDKLSNLSASLATVKDGDQVLWFEGTTENHFQGPTLQQLEDWTLEWIDIDSEEDLRSLASSSDPQVLDGNYRLTCDLDLSDSAFSGIGSRTAPFTGIFDGQNHTVRNVTVEKESDNVGFFNVIRGATIKNLNLENVNVTGANCTGGLAGWAQVQLDQEDMSKNVANLIGNCTVSGNVSGDEKVGGLIGLNDGETDQDTLFSIASSVDKSSFRGTVKGSYQVGGFAGLNEGTITKANASGEVQSEEGIIIGGFAGDNSGSIYDCGTDADVSGKNNVGGFVGYSDGIIKNSYSTGEVYGTNYAGSFAGSISNADYVIGAGKVNIVGQQSQGYVGGFAGNLGGTITGTDNQITIRDAYGNCTATDGKTLPAAGNNIDFNGDAQQAVLENMALTTAKEVSEKLYEMFGINMDVLEEEADQYADTVFVPYDVPAGTSISLLKDGAEADPQVTVFCTFDSEYLEGKEKLTLKKTNETYGTISIPVTLQLSSDEGTYTKQITVYLSADPNKSGQLMDRIAQTLTESSDGWTAMDMAAYSTLSGKTLKTSEAARENVTNLLITEAAGEKASAGDRSRIEIVLRALGADSCKLYAANSQKMFSNADSLQKMDMSTADYFSAPYILLADLQGNVKLTDHQVDQLISVLSDHVGDGLFGYTYDGVNYSDPDTAAVALAALASYCEQKEEARTIADKIMTALPKALNENGSFGNANSDAMVITGLIAYGEDPYELKSQNGISVVDGLMSYVNSTGDGFLYNGTENALATEQGFRALVALSKYAENGQKAYNIYDFSWNPVSEAHATGSGSADTPQEPTSPDEITVYVGVRTDTETWLSSQAVTVKSDATVYHAFVEALDKAGMSQTGAAGGYVKSITNKDGVTLAEKDKGPNSGWMYTVNGKLPNVPLTSYSLSDGDTVLWYYTSDWTEDPGTGDWEEENVTSKDVAASVSGSEASANVSASDMDQLIQSAIDGNAAEITLNVTGAGQSSKVTVEIPKASLQAVADKTDASLKVDTALGQVTFDRRAMDETVKAASGSTIRIVLEKRSLSAGQKEQLGSNAAMTAVSLWSGQQEIRDLGSGKLTVGLPVSGELTGKRLAAATVDPEGKLSKISGRTVTIGGKNYYQFTLSAGGSFVLAEETLLDAAIAAQDEENPLIAGVENTTIEASSVLGDGYVKVKWTKSAGYKVDAYEIYRSTKKDSGYGDTPYFTTKQGGLSGWYKNTKELKKGIRYYYKVRGKREIDGKTYYTQWSNAAYRTYKAIGKGVRNTSVKAWSTAEKGNIRVNWKKSAGYAVDYYQVYRSTKRNSGYGEKPYFTTKQGGLSGWYKNTKNLKKGTRYYYKVRGVRELDGKKVYTQWSNLAYRVAK